MIYLAHTAADPDEVMAAGFVDDLHPLTDGLLAIDSSLSRSKVYHRLKALQPDDGPLLVAELTEVPKFKGMAPGALAWLRDRLTGSSQEESVR